MKVVTIAMMQLIISMIGLLTIGVLNVMSALKLKDSDKKDVYQKAVNNSIISLVGITMLLVFGLLFWSKSDRYQNYVPKITYLALLLSGILLLVAGSYSANIAINLQCDKDDDKIHDIWQYSTISAVIGIVGSILMLSIQAFLRRRAISGIISKEAVESKE